MKRDLRCMKSMIWWSRSIGGLSNLGAIIT